jgi:hypothetical protein
MGGMSRDVMNFAGGFRSDAKLVGMFSSLGVPTQHDKPLRLLNTVFIGLRITERGDIDLVGFGDLVLGTVADEDGLSTPLDDDLVIPSTLVSHFQGLPPKAVPMNSEMSLTYVLALRDGVEVDLNLGHGQNVGGSRHVHQEFYAGCQSSIPRLQLQNHPFRVNCTVP